MTDIEKACRFLKTRELLRIRERELQRAEMIETLKTMLAMLAEQFEYSKVYLYGSWCRSCQTSESDIDLAVIGEMDFTQTVRLQSELERNLKRFADIRLLKTLPFQDSVVKEGVPVYDRENKTS